MEILVKYNFLFNGSKYYELNYYENIFYFVNILNIVISYSIVINFIISIFTNYKIESLLLSSYYVLDLCLIYNLNSNHLKKLINRNITLILPIKFQNYLKIMIYFSFCLSLLLATIITLLFNYSNYHCSIVENNWSNILNTYCLFFLTFYSINIKVSSIIYFLVFINNLTDNLKQFIHLVKDNNPDINNLVYQYLEIRHKYNQIIFVFNSIISNIVSFCIIPTFDLIFKQFNNELFDIVYYMNFIYFVLFCIVFHIYTNIIDDNIKYLKSLSDKNNNIKDYIIRKKNLYTMQNDSDLTNINLNEINLKHFMLNLENGRSLDWLILSEVLMQPLRPIEIFGIEISNSTIITKIVTVFIFILIGWQIM